VVEKLHQLPRPFVTHIGQGFEAALPRRQSLIETKRLSGPAGSKRMRTLVTSIWPLSFFARLETLNRRIPTPPQCQINPLQHEVMDFETHRRTSPCTIPTARSMATARASARRPTTANARSARSAAITPGCRTRRADKYCAVKASIARCSNGGTDRTRRTAVVIEMDEEPARKECLAVNLKRSAPTASWLSGFWIIRDGLRFWFRAGWVAARHE